nr:hypothetical protein CFP56_53357 [Quercus suber]
MSSRIDRYHSTGDEMDVHRDQWSKLRECRVSHGEDYDVEEVDRCCFAEMLNDDPKEQKGTDSKERDAAVVIRLEMNRGH